MRQKLVDFFLLYDTGVDFGFRNNFANSGSFAKVSDPLQFIIPWCLYVYIISTILLYIILTIASIQFFYYSIVLDIM